MRVSHKSQVLNLIRFVSDILQDFMWNWKGIGLDIRISYYLIILSRDVAGEQLKLKTITIKNLNLSKQ